MAKKEKPFMDPKGIKLLDGSEVGLVDFNHGSLMSAFIIGPASDDLSWSLFSYGRSGSVAGEPSTMATEAHTNIPRSGDSGLPMDWAMLVRRWRAVTAESVEAQALVDFAGECGVRFNYNCRPYATTTLLDLLRGPQQISGEEGAEVPVHMRESLMFGVDVSCSSPAAARKFRAYLASQGEARIGPQLPRLAQISRMAELEGAAAGHFEKACVAELRPILAQDAPPKEIAQRLGGLRDFAHECGRGFAAHVDVELASVLRAVAPSATFWVHLEGLVRRCVV